MNNAPEGLEYSTDNDKYTRADMPESKLEKGKFEEAISALPNTTIHKAAEALRMKDGGCEDPMYHDKHKNL
jgi:hypothetical protein